MTLAHLQGLVIGPVPLRVSPRRMASYVEVTGDQPGRWGQSAPPGMASNALFAVAPQLLSHPAVMESGGAAVHGEQVFRWLAPLRPGEQWSTRGQVRRVRRRRGVWFVDFGISMADRRGRVVVEGSSSFLIAGGKPPGRGEASRAEPPHSRRDSNQVATPASLPEVGKSLPPLLKSASRSDLVRYAAATEDWNPIHWDHEAAVQAGLGGVVVHGLACSAWMCQGVTRLIEGDMPLRKARFRYRRPLLPAIGARVVGKRVTEDRYTVRLEAGDETLIAATMETARD